jgi:hypothetical protein
MGAAGLVAFSLFLAGCGSSGTTTTTGFSSLIGKRVPGTSSAWLAIASPEAHPVDVAGSSSPPLVTNDDSTGQAVYFFEFPSSEDASAFYSNPPVASELVSTGVQAVESVSGATGVPTPSRWLDLRECLWSGGPGEGGTAGAGTPSGGKMNSAGKCSVGTPSSIGFAIIMQRSTTVAIAQAVGGGSVLGSAGIQAAIDSTVASESMALAAHTSELLKTVGVS